MKIDLGHSNTSFHDLNELLLVKFAEKCLALVDAGTEEEPKLQFYHDLLVSHLKVSKPEASAAQPLPPHEVQERIWDLFALPESERARRRASVSQQG